MGISKLLDHKSSSYTIFTHHLLVPFPGLPPQNSRKRALQVFRGTPKILLYKKISLRTSNLLQLLPSCNPLKKGLTDPVLQRRPKLPRALQHRRRSYRRSWIVYLVSMLCSHTISSFHSPGFLLKISGREICGFLEKLSRTPKILVVLVSS